MSRPARACSVDGCDKRHEGRGYCAPHLQRVKKWGDPRPDVPLRQFGVDRAPCSVDACERQAYARTYCRRHYIRFQRYGDPLGLSEWAKGNRAVSERWEARKLKPGDRQAASDGYVYVYAPESGMANSRGFVFEHRLVMAEHLGRDLEADESVHHENGNKADNRIENLELWVSLRKQPKGQRPADLVGYAREILKRYSGEVDAGLL